MQRRRALRRAAFADIARSERLALSIATNPSISSGIFLAGEVARPGWTAKILDTVLDVVAEAFRQVVLRWKMQIMRLTLLKLVSPLNQCQPKNAHGLTKSRSVLRNRPRRDIMNSKWLEQRPVFKFV